MPIPENKYSNYAFPPQVVPSYLSLTSFLAETNRGLSEQAQLNRKNAEGIALSGILDLLSGQNNCVTLDQNNRLQIAPSAVKTVQNIEKVNINAYCANLDKPIFNVRVRPAQRVDSVEDSTREFLGWHAQLTPEQERLAVTRWWNRPPEKIKGENGSIDINIEGMPFLATINGLVIYVGIIRGIEQVIPGGLAAYDVCVDESDAELGSQVKRLREDLIYKRIDSPRGGNVAFLTHLSEN